MADKADRVRAIIITHGHEDHTGAIRHVLSMVNAPIYATPLTRGLLEVKLARGGLLSEVELNTVRARETIELGPFTVEFFHVCHSIPDGVGLGITTPAGLIVHSGDYKFDHTPVDNWPTDYAKLGEFGGRGVLALLADSTNADEPGWTASERVIDAALNQAIRNAAGRVIVATFASLISRMQQVSDAALQNGRRLAFVGTSMVENAKMARKLGYLDVPDALIVSLDEALTLPSKQVVLMCTGSQGEPSSILGRLSTDNNRRFSVQSGDTVILSSHPIPGNEETVYKTINRLFRRGADVIYDPIAPVHVSGHASQEEMKLLLQLVRPKHLIPIHGELRHLHQHAAMARELGIPDENAVVIENGQVVEFVDGELMIGERVPGSYVFVDGASVGDIGPSVVRERGLLARDGFVLVNLILDQEDGHLLDDPEIITRGFVYAREADELLEATRNHIRETLRNANGNLQREIQQSVRAFLYAETRRRPMVLVTMTKA